MSALLSSTEAEAPVRFGRTRVVLAVLVVLGTLVSLRRQQRAHRSPTPTPTSTSASARSSSTAGRCATRAA